MTGYHSLHEWDDVVSLSHSLEFLLANQLGIGETKASELASAMTSKSEKTIREYREPTSSRAKMRFLKPGKYQHRKVRH